MAVLQIPGTGDAPVLVEREVLGTLLDVKVGELAYEDGTTLDQAIREIRGRLFPEQSVAQIKAPIMLSAAIEAAHRSAVSVDMARKVEGTGRADRSPPRALFPLPAAWNCSNRVNARTMSGAEASRDSNQTSKTSLLRF